MEPSRDRRGGRRGRDCGGLRRDLDDRGCRGGSHEGTKPDTHSGGGKHDFFFRIEQHREGIEA